MISLNTPRYAVWRLLAGALMISFSAVFVRLTSVAPNVSGFYRVFIGGLVLLGVVVWRRERLLPARVALSAILAAGVFFALDLAAWHRSIDYVGPGLATLLANFQVFALAAVGILVFREPARWPVLLSVPVAFTGVAMIIGFDWSALRPSDQLGVIFGLATAVFYSGYILTLRRVRHVAEVSPAVTIMWVSLAAAALLAVATPLGGDSLAIPSGRDGLLLCAYAVCGQALGWLLISSALGFLRASQIGLILLIQPVCSYLWDILLFDLPLSGGQVAGAALALSAIYVGSTMTGAAALAPRRQPRD